MSVNDNPLATELAALTNGEKTPTEYIRSIIARISDIEPEIHSLVDRPNPDRLLGIAEDLTRRYRHRVPPKLFGIPVGVKDIFHVEGFPTKAGSTLPADVLTRDEGTAMQRLRKAGAYPLAKTVTTEFAYFAPGPTRNPYDRTHTPGGSSSGSAAAVAAGLCPLALGTQTVGSTIRPAAFCGIVGYKPTHGRIPTDGLITFSESADHVGVFTQDVAGARLAGSILCGDWNPVRTHRRPTLGVPEGPYLEHAEAVGRSRFRKQVNRLETAGFPIKSVSVFEEFEQMRTRHNDMIAAEFALTHYSKFDEYGDQFEQTTVDLVKRGRSLDIEDLAARRAESRAHRRHVEKRMDDHGIDLWICPASPGPAPKGIDSTGNPVMNLPWTNLGMPAATIPAGDVDNLPIGLQCVGPTGDDERLLSWASEIESSM